MLTQREHARLARELIEACGGLDEAAATGSRSKSKLSDYQNPNMPACMPADVIDCLQSYCGRPIYSEGLSACFTAPVVVGEIVPTACRITEGAAVLQALSRQHMADGRLSPREIEDLAKAMSGVEGELDQARAILRAHETRPTLKAV